MNIKDKLNLKNLILLMIGNMIGVGIFLYSTIIASKSNSPKTFLLFWVFGAFTAIFGAISSSILAINKPETGGDYAYLRNAYGNRTAFTYGSLAMLITFPGSIAIGTSLTVKFQLYSFFGNILYENFYLGISYQDLISSLIILFLVFVNLFGIDKSILLQKFVTIFPISFLIILFISLFINIFFSNQKILFFDNLNLPESKFDFQSISIALVAVYWTYTGWNAPLTLGEEVSNAKKNLPLVMILGPIFVLCIYLFFSISFLSFIPFIELQYTENDIFLKLIELSLKNFSNSSVLIAGKILSAVIFFIVIGNMNSTLITGSRILYAMSKDKLFFENFSGLNKNSVPNRAILFLGLFAILQIFVFKNNFKILSMSFISMSILSILTILSVYKIEINFEIKKNFFYRYGFYLAPILYSVFTLLILYLVIQEMILQNDYFILGFSILIFLIIYLISILREKIS